MLLCGKDIIVDTGRLGSYLAADESLFTRVGDNPVGVDGSEKKKRSSLGEKLIIMSYPELHHAEGFEAAKDIEPLTTASKYCAASDQLVTM